MLKSTMGQKTATLDPINMNQYFPILLQEDHCPASISRPPVVTQMIEIIGIHEPRCVQPTYDNPQNTPSDISQEQP